MDTESTVTIRIAEVRMQSGKNERFEMRLDQQTIDRVDEWRGEQSDLPSRAEAIRRLVDKGLSTDDQTSFSGADKLIISLLCEIHPNFKARRELDPKFISDALYGGHNWGIRWRHPGVFEARPDNEQTLAEVVDILDMWSFLEEGYESLPDEGKEQVKKDAGQLGDVRFRGFDGNNETSHYGIARFLVEKLDRFERFEKRDLNSHSPSIDIYRRMLPAFLPMRRTLMGVRLNASQIITILNEQTHPEYRGNR